MIRFSLRQLTYFAAIADHGSTVRAADFLNVSQPAISMAMTQLEEIFQQKLFVRRHAQGLVLTPFGRQKLAEVRKLLSQADALADTAEMGPLAGGVNVGILSTLAPAFAPGILREFRGAYPGVSVRLREEPFDTLYHALDNGVIELALCYELDMPENVEREVLGEFRPYVLLPHGHVLARNTQVSLHDLTDQTFVLIDLPHSRDYFLSLFGQVRAALPTQILRFRSLETVRGMVANGHGVSILVTRPAGDAGYDGKRLACRPIKERVVPQRAVIARSTLFSMTRAGRAFVDSCRHYFAKQASNLAASQVRRRVRTSANQDT